MRDSAGTDKATFENFGESRKSGLFQDNSPPVLSHSGDFHFPCNHKGMRAAVYSWVNSSNKRRMEWCKECGELLDDREYDIPLPQ